MIVLPRGQFSIPEKVIFRETQERIHHLQAQNWSLAELGGVGIFAFLLASVHSPEGGSITHVVMIMNSSVSCDI